MKLSASLVLYKNDPDIPLSLLTCDEWISKVLYFKPLSTAIMDCKYWASWKYFKSWLSCLVDRYGVLTDPVSILLSKMRGAQMCYSLIEKRLLCHLN